MTDLSLSSGDLGSRREEASRTYRGVAMQCLAIFVVALVWQMRWGTVADTSWDITIVERVLAGERLYIDLLEVNPPFTVWLYTPPVVMAQALGVWPEIVVHAYTYLAAFLGLGFAALILRRGEVNGAVKLVPYLPGFLALLVIFPGIAFSEREHFGVALILPLFALMAWRANAQASNRPGLGVALLAGLAGSIIVLVKPYYALTILAPALVIAWRMRRLFFLFAIEYWVIGVVATVYLMLVQYLHPEFLAQIYPILADTYLLLSGRLWVLLVYGGVCGPLLALIWWMWPRGAAAGDLTRIALAASLASFVPLVYQGKGWAYHAYPTVAFAIIAFICLIADESAVWASGGDRLRNGRRKPSRLLVAACVAASWAPFSVSQRPAASLVNAIRDATVNPTVVAIGSDMAFGHPLTRMIGGRWVSRYCADWLGVFALYLKVKAVKDGDSDKAAFYQTMLETFVDEKKREFEVRPDIVVFQKDEPFWTARMLAEFGFSEILDEYKVIAEGKKIRIYLRADYRKPEAEVTTLLLPVSTSD